MMAYTVGIIALAVAFSAIACFAVLIRFWIRLKRGQPGPDDWAVFSSVVLGVAYSGISIYQTRWGLGLELPSFPKENVVQFSKVQYSGGPTYCLALLGFKLSLLFAYYRLAGFNRTYRLIIYGVMVLVTANQVAFALVLSFACQPIAKQWDASIAGGHCINELASYFALGGSSLGFDIIIISLPFPVLSRLQLNLKEKLVIGFLFALGFFVTVIQVIRIFTIANLANYTDSARIISWSIVEINLGIIVACVPTFRSLFKSIFSRASGYIRSTDRAVEARLSNRKPRAVRPAENPTLNWEGVGMTTFVESRPRTYLDQDQESEAMFQNWNKNEIRTVTELIVESEERPEPSQKGL